MKVAALGVMAGVVLAASGGAARAATVCSPVGLIRLVTTNVTPGAKLAAFAARPLVMYRSGSLLMRTEEADDPQKKLHLLMVTNAPDTWMVNLTDKTGQHIVDRGPTFEVHAPIFSGEGVSRAFADLEFGCEAQFVAAHMAKPDSQAAGVTTHRLRDGDQLLELKLAAGGRPVEAGYYKADKPVLVIRYDAFERGLPADPKLFARPEGFTYVEKRLNP